MSKILKSILVGGFLLMMVGAVVAGVLALAKPSEHVAAQQGTDRQSSEVVARRGANAQARGNSGLGSDDSGADSERGAGAQRTSPSTGAGQGQGRGTSPDASAGQGQGRGTSPSTGADQGQGRGTSPSTGTGQGQGQGRGSGGGQGQGGEVSAEPLGLETIQGTVVETNELVLQTADGLTVQVGLGPSEYRDNQGFTLNVNDTVRVTGYWEDDEFKATQVENLENGTSIVLRDTSGRPMWAGQGRGQSRSS